MLYYVGQFRKLRMRTDGPFYYAFAFSILCKTERFIATVTLYTFFRKVPGSKFGRDTGCPD